MPRSNSAAGSSRAAAPISSSSIRPKRFFSLPTGSATNSAKRSRRCSPPARPSLVTLRSDFLDRAAGLPRIGDSIGRGVYAIGPLGADGLREAIERPAARAGLRLEPGLVELIVRDAADRRTTLPHVSHALWWRPGSDEKERRSPLPGMRHRAASPAPSPSRPNAAPLPRHTRRGCRAVRFCFVWCTAAQTAPQCDAPPLLRHLSPIRPVAEFSSVLWLHVSSRPTATRSRSPMKPSRRRGRAWTNGWKRMPRALDWWRPSRPRPRLWNGSGRRDDDLLRGARSAGCAGLARRVGAGPHRGGT